MNMVHQDPQDRELNELAAGTVASGKPSLAEMQAWVAQWEPLLITSAHSHREVHGHFLDDQVRTLAVIRQLLRFLGRCAECPEDIATVFRAVEHRKSRRLAR